MTQMSLDTRLNMLNIKCKVASVPLCIWWQGFCEPFNES